MTPGGRRQPGTRRPLLSFWPIARTFIPWHDAWQVSGCGSAWVVQQQPDGRYSFVAFELELLFGGLTGAFTKMDMTEPELEALMTDLTVKRIVGPWEEGPLSLLSIYVWGAYVLSIRDGEDWSSDMLRYLDVAPKPEGNPDDWEALLVGKKGITNPELWRVASLNRPGKDFPEDKEPVVITTINFSLEKTNDAIDILKEMEPEFSFDDPGEDGEIRFAWTREYAPGHENPLAGRDGRQVLA